MDVKDTREVLIAVNELAIFLIKQFRDGLQLSDFMDIYMKLTEDDDFKEKMMDAFEGMGSIPEEVGDIDIAEVIELSSLQLSFLPEIVNAIRDSDDST